MGANIVEFSAKTVAVIGAGSIGRGWARSRPDLYFEMTRHPPPARRLSDELIRKVESERRAVLPREQLGEGSAWRDQRLMLLAAHKAAVARR